MGFCIRIQNTDSDPGNIALMYSVIFPVTDNYQQQQKMVYRLSDLASVKIYLIVSAVVRKKKTAWIRNTHSEFSLDSDPYKMNTDPEQFHQISWEFKTELSSTESSGWKFITCFECFSSSF